MSIMNKTYLHTGSNLGDKALNLSTAVAQIESKIGPVKKVSRVYQTKAWGITNQPDFLNQAIEVETALKPYALLATINKIEYDMGRKREIKWGERLIDIDILFYNDAIIQDEPKLIIPHPYLHYRNFVLVPMMEIAPQLLHPIFNQTITQLYSNSEDELIVESASL